MKEESGILGADSFSADAKLMGHGTITDGFEMSRAKIPMGMNAYEAEQKIIAYRNGPPQGGYLLDTNNYGVKALGIFFAITLIVAAVFKIIEWLPPLSSPVETAQRYFGERKASKRFERFSDFSKRDEWPTQVQSASAQFRDLSLDKLLLQIPLKLGSLPADKRDALAAAVWFKVAEQGSNAHAALVAIQSSGSMAPNPSVAVLVVKFLEKYCQAELEVACLDAAKVYAGSVFLSATGDEGAFLDKRALEYLPTTGRLSTAPAIVELRARISGGR